MIETVVLLWRFMRAQPVTRYFDLAPWHLLALLMVLGVLSAMGLHYLVGHVFRFYRRKGRVSAWVSVPSLVVFLISVPGLLAIYLLGVNASALVDMNLAAPTQGATAGRVGELLLEPAFSAPVMAGQDDSAITGHLLFEALDSVSGSTYRAALQERLHGLERPPTVPSPEAHTPPAPVPPEQQGGTLPPGPQNGPSSDMTANGAPLRPEPEPLPTAGPDANDLLMALALSWATNTDTMPQPQSLGQDGTPTEGSQTPPGEDAVVYLPDFIKSLVDELPSESELSRRNWEYVAGTNFIDRVLRPVLTEYVSFFAIALAILLALADAAFFFLMHWLKGLGTHKPIKPATAVAGKETAPPPAPAPVTAPAEPPVSTG